MKTGRIFLLSLYVLALVACGSDSNPVTIGVDGKPQVETDIPAGQDVPPRTEDAPILPEDASEITPDPDVPRLVDVTGDEKDDPVDLVTIEDLGPQEIGPPEHIPKALNMVWTNIRNYDMVTVRKKIVIEFEAGTPMPTNQSDQAWYDELFEIHVGTWNADTREPDAEVEMVAQWRHEKPGFFRRPALVLTPAMCDSADMAGCPFGALEPQYLPTQPYLVTVNLGDQVYERVFHTIPGWAPGYKIVEFIVEPEECERCFPYPVKVNVFIPPEYRSETEEYNNTSIPWSNNYQRYPAVVGLHTYGADGMKLADTFGWGTLPRFTSQGVVEPTLLVLPDGTVPEPYCGGGWTWPVNGSKTCYTQFMGIPKTAIPDFNDYTSYSYFMANTMRKEVAKRFRIRGMDDEGNKLDDNGNAIDEENNPDAPRDFYRRAWGITGCSGGGFGTPINTFLFPQDYGAMLSLIGASPSMFNPYGYHGHSGITHAQVCNVASNTAYPIEPVGDGYRDLSMMDPATITACPEGMLCKRPQGYCRPADECLESCDADLCAGTGTLRDVTYEQREIPQGAKSCFWFAPPAVSNDIVTSLLCGLDTTCRADDGAPEEWRCPFEDYPFDGNLMFTTGLKDHEGPPAAFIDLDQQLDKRGVAHSFRYEDRGAIFHDWNAVHDYVEGWYEIERKDGVISPGNFPGTGILYPFMNNAFENLGNYAFNHPFASEFSTGALDPDRDYVIDLIYPNDPSMNFIEDNCPGVENPKQEDSDGDGIGDACDDD